MKLILALVIPWLAACTLAAPLPTPVTTALAPFAWIEITLPLVLLHETGRAGAGLPLLRMCVARSGRVCPRLNVMLLPGCSPDEPLDSNGSNTIGWFPA